MGEEGENGGLTAVQSVRGIIISPVYTAPLTHYSCNSSLISLSAVPVLQWRGRRLLA